MATAKTGSFYLTETITLPAASAPGTRVQGSIDLGAYVNVATGQAIAIDQVDFIWQRGDTYSQLAAQMATADAALSMQLSDLNPGTRFIRADNQSLIASGSMQIDFTNNVTSLSTDLYPDNFGPAALSESFMVVNDSLYLVGGIDSGAPSGAEPLSCTVRIRARVVKLSNKDWMAIAIQSTASDN
jgi:hypothetical protein